MATWVCFQLVLDTGSRLQLINLNRVQVLRTGTLFLCLHLLGALLDKYLLNNFLD
jgi:hypothetical protein